MFKKLTNCYSNNFPKSEIDRTILTLTIKVTYVTLNIHRKTFSFTKNLFAQNKHSYKNLVKTFLV